MQTTSEVVPLIDVCKLSAKKIPCIKQTKETLEYPTVYIQIS